MPIHTDENPCPPGICSGRIKVMYEATRQAPLLGTARLPFRDLLQDLKMFSTLTISLRVYVMDSSISDFGQIHCCK